MHATRRDGEHSVRRPAGSRACLRRVNYSTRSPGRLLPQTSSSDFFFNISEVCCAGRALAKAGAVYCSPHFAGKVAERKAGRGVLSMAESFARSVCVALLPPWSASVLRRAGPGGRVKRAEAGTGGLCALRSRRSECCVYPLRGEAGRYWFAPYSCCGVLRMDGVTEWHGRSASHPEQE